MDSIKKILILRFSSLGDIVMSTPMIRVLRKRYPLAQIDMVVRSEFLDLISENPYLDQKIGLLRLGGMRELFKLLRLLNQEGYDLIYDAHVSLRTIFLMPLLRSRFKAYYKKNYLRRSLLLTFKLPLLKNAPRMVEKYVEPLKPFGVEFDKSGPELFLSKQSELSALSKISLPLSQLVGIIPSAQWQGKRWPKEYFRELLIRLVENTHDHYIVFGGKEDHFCSFIADGLPQNRVFNAQGKFSIAESAQVLKRCKFVIANDTGLMHVADAVRVPSVLILGPTSKEMGCLPYTLKSRVIENEMWCRPCSKNGEAPCIRLKRHCLHEIKPDRVLSEAHLLARELC